MIRKRLMLTALFLLTVFLAVPALAGEEKITASRSEVPEAVMIYMFPDGVPEGMRTHPEIGTASRLYYYEDGADYQAEYITQMEITFVSGDEILKDAAYVGDYGHDARFFAFDQKVPVQGPSKAVYHVNMESEHYTWEQNVTVYCLPWKGYEAFEIPDSKGFVYYYDPDAEYVSSGAVFESCMNLSLDGLEERLKSNFPDMEDESVWMFYILLNKPGLLIHEENFRNPNPDDGPIEGLVIQGMGLDIRCPLKTEARPFAIYGEETASAGESVHLVLEETDGAGRNFTWTVSGPGTEITESSNTGAEIHISEDATGRFTVIATPDDGGSSAIKKIEIGKNRICSSFGELAEKEKVNADLSGDNWRSPWKFFAELFYAPSTVPKELDTINARECVCLVPKGKNSGSTTPDAGALEFVSGDESLRNALGFELPEENGYDDNVYLVTRLNRGTKPGEAVFRLRLRAGELYYESEFIFRALSWEKYPMFELRNPDRSGIARKGEGPVVQDRFGNVMEGARSTADNTGLYSKSQVAELVIRDRSYEVMKQFLTDELLKTANEVRQGDGMYSVYIPRDNDSNDDRYPQKNLWVGFNYYDETTAVQFRETGEYRISTIESNLSNVIVPGEMTIRVLSYQLTGPSTLMPGESGTYAVKDTKPEEGRTFTLSAEGEGVSFDAETGMLTVAEDTPEETAYTVRAVPSDGGPEMTIAGKVKSGLLAGEEFSLKPFKEGFSVPVLSDKEKYNVRQDEANTDCIPVDAQAPLYVYIGYHIFLPLDEFAEDSETADKYYNYKHYEGYDEYQQYTIPLGDHHARAHIYKNTHNGIDYSEGYLHYVRNNQMLQVRVYAYPQDGTQWDDLTKVTMSDLRRIAEMIEYDPAKASITAADGVISLKAKEGTDVLTAGKKLTMQAVFASPKKISKKAKNDTINWTVTDPATGTAPAGVTIDQKGVLSAGKQIAEVLHLEVKAESPVFHTSAVFPVTVLPAAKAIATEPAEVFFYTGTDSTVTVRTKMDPETVPPVGITWTSAKKGIVEIVPDEGNGTAVIRPLKAGKTTVTVKEPGGKSVKLPVSVTDPVTDIALAVKGKAVPGGTVTVTAATAPKTAGNTQTEWSLDVGEDIAVFSKGKISIAKTAPAGTVITVTCTALGAPEPVVRTIQITVE